MKLNSFFEDHGKLCPLEVEIELWPGLPEIHFLGGADQYLKESAKRIKSAIRNQGFDFRPSQQVLVNLRPSYLKKSSRGLELAIALGYLVESGQITLGPELEKATYYGELSLKGDIEAPENLAHQYAKLDHSLVTGKSSFALPYESYQLAQLQDIKSDLTVKKAEHSGYNWAPPKEVLELKISTSWARLLGIVALGQHSFLMAGTSGSGKTTAAKILHALLPEPNKQEQDCILSQLAHLHPGSDIWRPFINPHHTIPLNSLIGGGSQAHGGELSRSHLGLLLLDEFFEFSPHVMEALREPLETKSLRISRGPIVRTFPLQSQVIATTNLCPCGEWIPGKGAKLGCRFTLQKCRSYSSRITGPLLDRFEVLSFVSHQDPRVEWTKPLYIREKLTRLRQQLSRVELATPPWLEEDALFKNLSQRRKAATLALARSIALWDEENQVNPLHIEEAAEYTVRNFQRVKQWDLG